MARRFTDENRPNDSLSDGPIRRRETRERERAAEIIATWRQFNGLITPDYEAFERILRNPDQPLREAAAADKNRLRRVFEEIIVEAAKLTAWNAPTQKSFQSSIDSIEKVAKAIELLGTQLQSLEPPFSGSARGSEERFMRLKAALSQIEEDVRERRDWARDVREWRGQRNETKPPNVWRNTVFSRLCGFYEFAFDAKASAAQPDGPTMRFIRSCFNEVLCAIAASELTNNWKVLASKQWTFPEPQTARTSLRGVIMQRRRALERGDVADGVCCEWEFAQKRWAALEQSGVMYPLMHGVIFPSQIN